MTATVPMSTLLSEARVAAGLTQQALADRSGLHIRRIHRLEQGIGQLKVDELRQLAPVLPDLDANAVCGVTTRPVRRGDWLVQQGLRWSRAHRHGGLVGEGSWVRQCDAVRALPLEGATHAGDGWRRCDRCAKRGGA